MVPHPPITTLMFLFLWEDSNLRKRAKCLIRLAHPEELEPPTTWFEDTYSFAEFTAELCGFLEIKFLGNSEIRRDKPQ